MILMDLHTAEIYELLVKNVSDQHRLGDSWAWSLGEIVIAGHTDVSIAPVDMPGRFEILGWL